MLRRINRSFYMSTVRIGDAGMERGMGWMEEERRGGWREEGVRDERKERREIGGRQRENTSGMDRGREQMKGEKAGERNGG